MGERGAEFWRYDDAELRGWRHELRNAAFSFAVDHLTVAFVLVVGVFLLPIAGLGGWLTWWAVGFVLALVVAAYFGRELNRAIGQRFGPTLRWKGLFGTTSGAKNCGLVNRQREAGKLAFRSADDFGRVYHYRVPSGFSPRQVEDKAEILASYFGAHRLTVKRLTPTTVEIFAADRDAITESHSAEWITDAG